MGDVSGTVTYEGEPLEKGSIVFEVPGMRTAHGEIVNGQIQNVTTFDPGDGVPVGEADVAIVAVKDGDSDPETKMEPEKEKSSSDVPGGEPGNTGVMPTPEFSIPPKYTKPQTSGLSASIQEGKNTLEFNLTP